MKNIVLIIAIVLLGSLNIVRAANFTSNAGSWSWDNPLAWIDGVVPPGNVQSNIYIADGSVITAGNLLFTKNTNLYVLSGGELIINDVAIDIALEIEAQFDLHVDEGGILTINGDVTSTKVTKILVTGDVYIDGNISLPAGGSTLTVNRPGVLQTTGTITGVTPTGTGVVIEAGTVVLKIDLIYFNVTNNESTITLTWQTASEENNDYFTIERAPDGINYETIATIAGAGNSKDVLSYSYVDNNPLMGNSYYRLKQTDFEGAHEYFDAVSISYLNEEDLQIAWVPDSKTVTIDASGSMGYAKLQIVNMAGAVVKNVYKLENNLSIDVSNLKRGMYIVSIIGGDARIVKKIMIY